MDLYKSSALNLVPQSQAILRPREAEHTVEGQGHPAVRPLLSSMPLFLAHSLLAPNSLLHCVASGRSHSAPRPTPSLHHQAQLPHMTIGFLSHLLWFLAALTDSTIDRC
jgi:hypothetical protein